MTRSDLLAPRKEQVDGMMPILVDILRDALSIYEDHFRLGNVYCVSSKRGWWTRKLKDDIRKRGGGSWMVGKVNVGKSSLVEAIFPKGEKDLTPVLLPNNLTTAASQIGDEPFSDSQILRNRCSSNKAIKGLLPPIPHYEPYPVMPTASDLPGTTMSPIRLPFDNGRGELVDLPGLSRNNLDEMVSEESQPSLIMTHRVRAQQYSIKPGQSLVVSNIVRITPNFSNMVLLACPFLPLSCHVTNTDKAKAILRQGDSTVVSGIAKSKVGSLIKSAGNFHLKWDVTKHRTGPLTSSDAAKILTQSLPFVVYSIDLLLEGIGWIELVVQVRKRQIEAQEIGPDYFPSVEVFSPNGGFVGSRRPLNTWALGGSKRKPVSQRTSRPRLSKKGEKKRLKREHRVLSTRQ